MITVKESDIGKGVIVKYDAPMVKKYEMKGTIESFTARSFKVLMEDGKKKTFTQGWGVEWGYSDSWWKPRADYLKEGE